MSAGCIWHTEAARRRKRGIYICESEDGNFVFLFSNKAEYSLFPEAATSLVYLTKPRIPAVEKGVSFIFLQNERFPTGQPV